MAIKRSYEAYRHLEAIWRDASYLGEKRLRMGERELSGCGVVKENSE